MASGATTKDGVNIAYDDYGVGEPAFVCLPGWCSDRSQFSPIVDQLSDRARTIVLDWRGHGESDTPDVDFGYDEMTHDVLAVIDAMGIERIVPVAASHAGWAALELCRRLGDRVMGLVFMDWMVMGAPPAFITGLRRMQQPDGWAEVRDQLFQMWRGGGSNPGVEAQIAQMNSYGADTWMRAGREIEAAYQRHGAPVEVLASFDPPVPTMHVYAQPADPEVLQAQETFASEHRWFEVHRVDAQSHFPQFEVSDEIAGLIEDFASKL
ncbi:MAG: alpha/beta fold hydrolase [Chloroflexi bacterium]|nr:alpha/beta fold hydrolase [Chloroflexota bacterium]